MSHPVALDNLGVFEQQGAHQLFVSAMDPSSDMEACVITFPMFLPFLILRRHTNLPAPDF